MENVVQNEVGHQDWGLYNALLSFGFLFLIFSDLGINQYATKSLASEPKLLKQNFPQLFSIKIIATILYPVLMVGAGALLGYQGVQLYFLGLISLVQGGMQMLLFFRANFQAAQKFKLDGIASVADRFALLIVVGFLLWQGIGIDEFIYARLFTAGLMVLLFYLALTRMYGWLMPKWNWQLAGKILSKSYPFAMVMILYSILDKVDIVMLERISDDREAGLYSGAYRWMDAFSMYLWTVLPIFFARFAFFLNNETEKQKLLDFGQVIAAFPLLFVAGFVFFYGEKLMFLFTKSNPEELLTMVSCLKVLFIAIFINALFAIYSTLLTSTNHEKFVNKMILIGIVINTSLNFWLIPQMGALGSAWTTVITYAFMSVTYLVYIHFKLPIRVPFQQIFKLLIGAGIMLFSFWVTSEIGLSWIISTLISGLVYVGMALGLGIIPVHWITELLRKAVRKS